MKNPRSFLCPACGRSYENYHIASDHWHKNHTDIGPVVPMPWAWSAEGARFLRRGPSAIVKHPQLRYADQNNPHRGTAAKTRTTAVGFCGMGERMDRNPVDPYEMFRQGNVKLGPTTYTFSLPRAITCPGRTPWCEAHCYAKRGKLSLSSSVALYQRNLKHSQQPYFVDNAIRELRGKIASAKRRGEDTSNKVVRIHVSGDFYSVPYILKWMQIADDLKGEGWKFYAYTKSWAIPKLLPALEALRDRPNVTLRGIYG